MTAASEGPAGRSYGQLCPLACALDVLGERWTLLVVRELLLGPQRFNDLTTRLAGIGPNRLSARLKRLAAAGVAEKTADGSHVLTAYGEGLRAPLLSLGSWGMPLLPPVETAAARADLVALVMSGVVPPARLDGIDLVVEVRAGEVFTLTVSNGEMSVRSGESAHPADVRLACAPETFVGVLLGRVELAAVVETGDVTVAGASSLLDRLVAAFAETASDHMPVP